MWAKRVTLLFFVPRVFSPPYNPPEMQANEAAWYDDFYRHIQTQLGPWYRFALPYLRAVITRESRLLELGCGQGLLLRALAHEKLLPEENIYGMDQSRIAVDVVKDFLPKAHLDTGDIY